ncbi:teichoic acid D-Ala incorporation-associated protein DltX [Enterococcus hirae]
MKNWWNNPQFRYWGTFVVRTLLYSAIIFMLIYLYHYKNVQDGSFIYNEF